MEDLLNKLTEEQKTELGNLCQKINDIFEENDNFTEDDVDKFGTAVFVTECCEDPEEYRQERYNLIGEPTEEMIAEWKAKYGDFNKKVQKALKGE